MSRTPKLAPCPTCGTDERLDIYTYENGWRHVECNGCWALGPGEGSKRQAAESWNKRALERALTTPPPPPNPTSPSSGRDT